MLINLGLVLVVGLTQAGPQSQAAPPAELSMTSRKMWIHVLPETPQGAFVLAKVHFSTGRKTVAIDWEARGDSAAIPAYRHENHSLSFFPTAQARSWSDLNSFYVGGRFLTSTTLQHWTIGQDYQLSVVSTPFGVPKTAFTPPEITVEPLAVDPDMENISALTANPWPPGGGPEEVWILEWETRDVWTTNQTSGLRELRVSSSLVQPYCTLGIMEHSAYGMVCTFRRRKLGGDASIADLNDTDLLLVYDSDLDGYIDGTDVVPWSELNTHPILSGEMTVPW